MCAALCRLTVLACTLPIAFTSCVIVNINGSMNSELARSCLGEDRQSRTAACPPCRAEDKTSVDVKNVGNGSTKEPPSSNASPSEQNCSLLQVPEFRRTICVFISGFSFAAGLMLIGLLKMGDLTKRGRSRPVPLSESGSESSQESSNLQGTFSSLRAERGSSPNNNHPYRSAVRENRARQQERPISDRLQPPERAPSRQPRRESCSSRSFGNQQQNRSNPEKRTRVCMETAFTSTPASSMVALGPEEFWL